MLFVAQLTPCANSPILHALFELLFLLTHDINLIVVKINEFIGFLRLLNLCVRIFPLKISRFELVNVNEPFYVFV